VRTRCLAARGQTLVSLSELFASADRPAVESAVHTLGLEMQPVASCQASASTLPQLEDTEADGRMRPTLSNARVLRALGKLSRAKEAAQLAAEAAEDANAKRVAAEARLLAGQLSAELGEEGAERRLNLAIISAEAVGADEQRARAWMALITFHAKRKEFEAALFAVTQAEAIVERLGSPELLEAELNNERGFMLNQQGDAEGAFSALSRALALLRKHRPDDDALVMRGLNNTLLATPDARAAIEGFRQLLQLRERVLGADHPETALTQFNLAGRLLRAQRCDEAEREVRGALERSLRAGEPDALVIGREYSLQARVLKCQGSVAASIDAERDAIKSFEQGNEHSARLRAKLNFLLARLVEAGASPAQQDEVKQELSRLDP
jgi:tetratricopeptide (TPR) repeat protein